MYVYEPTQSIYTDDLLSYSITRVRSGWPADIRTYRILYLMYMAGALTLSNTTSPSICIRLFEDYGIK